MTIPDLLNALEQAATELGNQRRARIASQPRARYAWPWSTAEQAYVSLTMSRNPRRVAEVLGRPRSAIEEDRARRGIAEGKAAA